MDLRIPNNSMRWDLLLTYPIEKARADKKINFRNGVLIILNLIHFQDYRRVKDLRAGYFAPLNGEEMEKIFSKNGWGEIKKHLIENHIIEEDYYEKGVSSFGYRLIITKQGPETIDMSLIPQGSVYKNFLQYIEKNKEYSQQNNKKVDYLINQFERSELELDPSVYDFVKNYQLELFKLDASLNPSEDSYYGILMLVGGYIHDINKFNKGEVEPFVSKSNNRLYSIINTIKKEIRYYIRNGNNKFIEYDLSASYNYVLATILNYDFFTSTSSSYSLSNIFSLVYSRLVYLNSIDIKEQNNYISYMSPTYWELEDVKRYINLPFENDVYEWLRRMVQFDDDLNGRFKTNDRATIKDEFKSYFNLKESVIRKGKRGEKTSIGPDGLPMVKFMEKHFPSVNTLVSRLIYLNRIKSPLSLLMQRCEAYLVQEIAAKHIIDQHPNQLVFTIHDSLFIESIPGQNPELIVKEMKDVLLGFTGIMPGIKNKSIDPMTIMHEIVNEDYNLMIDNLNSSKPVELNSGNKSSITAALEFIYASSSRELKSEKRKLKAYWKKISSRNSD